MNKALLKRLKVLTDKELLAIANKFKVANRVYSNLSFQKDYTTLLSELKSRGLLK